MSERGPSSALYVKDATSRTTPRHIWMSAVLEMAHVSREDADRYVTRARLNRWYSDEMAVWIAASSVREFVKLGKAEERRDRAEPRPGDIIRASLRRPR